MVLMVVCAVGTELDLHAHLVSKPLHENLQPSAAGFHPRVNTRVSARFLIALKY